MDASAATTSQLTASVFGQELSLAEAWGALPGLEPCQSPSNDTTAWIGSIGYERFRANAEFAESVAAAGVEVLIDVRELPISRKRGFAKTALAQALAESGVEYIHWKALGNPKKIRDIYKAGDVERGRALFKSHLNESAATELDDLASFVRMKRCALMCVEHDPSTCHRTDILDALAKRDDSSMLVSHIVKD